MKTAQPSEVDLGLGQHYERAMLETTTTAVEASGLVHACQPPSHRGALVQTATLENLDVPEAKQASWGWLA